MDSVVLYIALAILPIGVLYFLNLRKKMRYWADRGVPHVKPLPFFGNSLPYLFQQDATHDQMAKLYKSFPNDKVIGTYEFMTPNLHIRDPDMLEKIFIKDFQYFTDHNPTPEDMSSLINMGLFTMTGTYWRSVRNKITPTFTTGKLKFMFDQMLPCADSLIETAAKHISDAYEIKDDLNSYSITIISNVVFGIDITEGAAREEFKKYSLEMSEMSFFKTILLIFASSFPKLANWLGINFLSAKTERYFRKIISDTFQQRKDSGQKRNDYVQLLLKLKEEGFLEMRQKDNDDEYLKVMDVDVKDNIEITDDLLAGQAFQFLTAGFDPLYGTMQFVLHHLSQNKEIQDKVRAEIKECVEKNKGYTYKALKDMTYLEQCVQESLRLHPIVPFLMRMCVKDYTTEDGWTIEKGTQIMVAILALHMDPNYFVNPEVFDPDRFHPDSTIKKFSYLPFGDGPRVCIGMRFAMMHIKLALAKLIENFQFNVSPKTQLPLKMDKRTFFIRPLDLYFDVKKL